MDDLTGKKLKEIWEIDVKHALYRETGDWYHILKEFPAALFDKNGYIIFENQNAFINDPAIQIGERVHVQKGISNISGYVRIIENGDIQEISKELNLETGVNERIPEGKMETYRKSIKTERIIRDTKVTNWVKKLYNNHCQICGTTIELFDNKNYSEGHHIVPLNHNGHDVINNLLCVCPNHHIQLDYGAIKIEKLMIKKGHNIDNEYVKYHNENIYKKSYGA